MTHRIRILLLPISSIAILMLLAIIIKIRIEIAGLDTIGIDPIWGWLFSPIPLLRIVAILQIVGGVTSCIGALLIFLREAKR